MKNVVFVFLVFGLALVTACSNKEEMNAHLASIQEASAQSKKLENGSFSYRNVVEDETNKHTQVTEGVFVVTDEYVDWYTKLIISESDSNTVTERIQKDKIQYQRFGMVNEEHHYIGTDNEVLPNKPKWQSVKEAVTDYPESVNLLMEVDLPNEYIKNVNKKIKDNVTQYEVTYKDSYLSSLKEENISEIKKQLEKAKKENAGLNVIGSLENSLAYNENMNFKSIKRAFTVNDAGILVGERVEAVYEQTINDTTQTIQVENHVELVEYNQNEIKVEL
ncbi:hypothetical protein [Ferdinandcohnia sp. Marseille-Q9671]